MIAVLLAWLYGMICGVMLLAGEREAGTLTFLDALPGLRRRLWLAKCLAGLVLVLAQIAFLMGVAAVRRLFEDWAEPAWTLGFMVYFGLFGFAWGLLFSSFGRSVMNLILAVLFRTGCGDLARHVPGRRRDLDHADAPWHPAPGRLGAASGLRPGRHQLASPCRPRLSDRRSCSRAWTGDACGTRRPPRRAGRANRRVSLVGAFLADVAAGARVRRRPGGSSPCFWGFSSSSRA